MRLATLTCPQCGESFERPWKQRAAKFCGHSCAIQFHREKILAAASAPEARAKMAASLRGRGAGKSYPKLGGRHAHRVVAEQKIGRPLRPGEIVHHKDENILNYAEDNLEVLPSQGEHSRLHLTGTTRPLQTHCNNGHEFTTENTYTYPGNDRHRACKACRRAYDNDWKKAKRRALGLRKPGPPTGAHA